MRSEYFTGQGFLNIPTQTAYILALMFDIAEEQWKPALAAELAARIERNGGHLDTGFLGTPLIASALSENGQSEAAYRLVLQETYPSWLYPIHQGASTMWEHWDSLKPDGSMWSPQMNSFNHYAYGSVGQWLYTNIGCLDLNASDIPGRIFSFRFNPGGGLSSGSLKYESVYGSLGADWSGNKDQGYELEISIPPNCRGLLNYSGYMLQSDRRKHNTSSRSTLPLVSGRTKLLLAKQRDIDQEGSDNNERHSSP